MRTWRVFTSRIQLETVMKTKLKTLIGLVFLSIIGYSCSPEIGDHASVYLKDGYGYQYDLPRDYCHTIETESELDIYCSEGKILLYIVPSGSQMELDQQIQGNLDTDALYSLGEENSNAGLKNGDIAKIKFAKLIDPTSNMLSQK